MRLPFLDRFRSASPRVKRHVSSSLLACSHSKCCGASCVFGSLGMFVDGSMSRSNQLLHLAQQGLAHHRPIARGFVVAHPGVKGERLLSHNSFEKMNVCRIPQANTSRNEGLNAHSRLRNQVKQLNLSLFDSTFARPLAPMDAFEGASFCPFACVEFDDAQN